MNGLNNTKKWNELMRTLFVVYGAILIAIILIFYNFSTVMSYFEYRRIDKIVEQVDLGIVDNTLQTQQNLPMIVGENNIELVVLTADELVYSTLSISDFSQITEIIKTENISYRKIYTLSRGTNNYQVCLIVYKLYDLYIGQLFIPIIILVVLECLLLSGMFFLMFRKVLSPMRNLQKKIKQLKDYNFDTSIDNEQERSQLVGMLQEFSEDLSSKINIFEDKYTDLEIKLQQHQEDNIYRMQLVQSLVHDLKTPLTISTVMNEQLQKINLNTEDSEKLQKLADIDVQLTKSINEILLLIEQKELTIKREQTNVIPIIREIIHLLQPLILKKQAQLEIICAPEIILTVNKIELKQIIHNIILNACKYVDVGGNLIVEAYTEDGRFLFRVYNDNEKSEQIDFTHVFDLFYTNTGDDTGSGVGMFVVKSMAEKIGGTVKFFPIDNGVDFWFELPSEKK